jgi:hypothetical protein
MLGLTLRDEFRGQHLPSTAISLVEPDGTGATQVAPDKILSITYPTGDIQTALRAFHGSRPPRPLVLQGSRGKGKSHLLALLHHAIATPQQVENWANEWAARAGISSIWLRSLSPHNTKGGTREQLHLDITRAAPIDDNAFQGTLNTILSNCFKIHGENNADGRLYFDLEDTHVVPGLHPQGTRWTEKDLEDYLFKYLPSMVGTDLFVIGQSSPWQWNRAAMAGGTPALPCLVCPSVGS